MKTTSKERIKLAMTRSGKSISDLARHMGLAQPSVSGVLNREGELDSLKYIEAAAELTGYRFEWLRTGDGPEKNNGEYSINDQPPMAAGEPEEIYRNLVEGHTEYVLIPRSVLNEKYRLVAVEQMEADRVEAEKDKRTIDRLLDQNEKLHEGLMKLLESKTSHTEKAK